MREFKFRGWDKEKKLMVYFGDFCAHNTNGFWGGTREVYQLSVRSAIGECNGLGYFHDDFAKEIEMELMQFTGLVDKTGKEIFESDIVKAKRREEEWIGLVKWLDDEIVGYRTIYTENKLEFTPYLCGWYEYEIIGNIFEHPELLKEIK